MLIVTLDCLLWIGHEVLLLQWHPSYNQCEFNCKASFDYHIRDTNFNPRDITSHDISDQLKK